jgi:hypothetical protein
LPSEGNQEAAQASLAKLIVQQAVNAALSSQSGTVRRVELQNEDGFLVYNVELVQEVKVDAGNGSILRIDDDSAGRETENQQGSDSRWGFYRICSSEKRAANSYDAGEILARAKEDDSTY